MIRLMTVLLLTTLVLAMGLGCAHEHSTVHIALAPVPGSFKSPPPDAKLDFNTPRRNFEATFYKLAVPKQTSPDLDFGIQCSEPEPLLRSGIIVVRRYRPIIRGKEGGAGGFGTTFGMVSYDANELIGPSNVAVHYELYMRRSPVVLTEDGRDKHVVRWFRKELNDMPPNRIDILKPYDWVLTKSVGGSSSSEVIGPRGYGDWADQPESLQKAALKLREALDGVVDE